jgi:hypothetical protein
MSSSDPYQSRFLRAMFRHTRRWIDHRQQQVRQVQVAASWGVQVLLYPVYAFFQTTRLLGKQVEKQVNHAVGASGNSVATERRGITEIVLPITDAVFSPDTAVQQVMQVVQGLGIDGIPVQVEPRWVNLRGIACQLADRALVLVTQDNAIVDGLSLTQQQQLADRMAEHLALCGQMQRAPALGKRVVRGILQGLEQLPQKLAVSWLPTGFGVVTLAEGLHRAVGKLADWAADAPVDLALQRSLYTAQGLLEQRGSGFLLPPPGASLALSSGGALRVASVGPLRRPSPAQSALDHLASDKQPFDLASDGAIASRYIRAVACCRDTQAIVLVTNHNESLNRLTADQQQQIRQRISWETAHYQRYLKLQQRAGHSTALRLPPKDRQVLPPVRLFWQLMAWMQQGSVAIAANLFQESAHLGLPQGLSQARQPYLPEARASQMAPPPRLPGFSLPGFSLPGFSLPGAIVPWRNRWPSQLAQFLRSPYPTGSAKPGTMPGPTTRAATPTPTGQPNPAGAIRVAPRSGLWSSPSGLPEMNGLAATGWEPTAWTSQPDTEAWDTEATALGYEPSLLERVLRWLDRALAWVERTVERLVRRF